MAKSASILIVEDESIAAVDIRRRLESWGHTVVATVATGADAISTAQREQPDLVLMDINLKGPMDGVEAAEAIQANTCIPVIYATAHNDSETRERAHIAGPFSCINKPYDDVEIRAAVELAFTRLQFQRRIDELESRYHELIQLFGKPPARMPEELLPPNPLLQQTSTDTRPLEPGSPLTTLRRCVGSLHATELTREQRTILETADHSLRSIEGIMEG